MGPYFLRRASAICKWLFIRESELEPASTHRENDAGCFFVMLCQPPRAGLLDRLNERAALRRPSDDLPDLLD